MVETGMDVHLNDLFNFAINVTCPFHGVSHYWLSNVWLNLSCYGATKIIILRQVAQTLASVTCTIAVPQMRWHIPSKKVQLTLAWHLLLCKFHKASPHWQTQNRNLYSVSTLQGVPNLLLTMWIHDDYHGHKKVLKIERIMIADFKKYIIFHTKCFWNVAVTSSKVIKMPKAHFFKALTW